MRKLMNPLKLPRRQIMVWFIEFAIWTMAIFGLLLLAGGKKIWPADHSSRSSAKNQIKSSHRLQDSYGRLLLGFEPNQGQAPPEVQYLSRLHNVGLYVKKQEFEAEWRQPANLLPPANARFHHNPLLPKSPARGENCSLQIQLVGSAGSEDFAAEVPLAGQSNYLTSGDPSRWHLNIPRYARLRQKSVYPGIDLLFYGNPSQLEFDFVVAPDSNPSSIGLQLILREGSTLRTSFELDEEGNLGYFNQGKKVLLQKPVIYQMIAGCRHPVEGSYFVKEGGLIGFEVGSYDRSESLIIDPVLFYTATGIGGFAVAADASGNAYVAGIADPLFPVPPGALQPTPGGGTCVIGPNQIPCADILVAKLNPSGTDLLYATFLGGSGADYAYGIAVDSSGHAYLTGTTNSINFPTTAGAFQTTHSGKKCGVGNSLFPCNETFVAKLNPAGSSLDYSTYLHGSAGGQGAYGLAVDIAGQAYITGNTENGDGFVTKLDSKGSAVAYTQSGIGGSAISVSISGEAFVAGRKGAQSFVSKVSADGKQVLFSTQLGGSTPVYAAAPEEVEAITGIAVDPGGFAYVTGYTAYQNFPTTPGVISTGPIGAGFCGNSICLDAFVAKLSNDGQKLLYSTYLGTEGIDTGNAIAVDQEGNAWIAGATNSSKFPYALDAATSQDGGIFIIKLNPQATQVLYAALLGSHEPNESPNSLALDPNGTVYVTGTAGTHMNATSGAFQRQGSGIFVTKIATDVSAFVPVILSSSGYNFSFYTSELTLANRSSNPVSLEYRYSAAIGDGSGSAVDILGAGKQVVIPDAISYLRSLKIPIPETGNQGGTLRIRFKDVPNPNEISVLVRTTTLYPPGRAGLAYGGVPEGFHQPVYLCGLRHDAHDRSNVAVQNMGTDLQGDITIRLSVFSGDPTIDVPPQIYEVSLKPGGFKQISGILQTGPYILTNGYVKVERIGGLAPYYAYGVINDQVTSDGSFVPPTLETPSVIPGALIIPDLVETASYKSEVVFTNWSATSRRFKISLRSDGIQNSSSLAEIELFLNPGEQKIIPDFISWFRQKWFPGIWVPESSVATPLLILPSEGSLDGVFVGARTSTPTAYGGSFGVFYSAVASLDTSTGNVWIYGLQQNAENRTNLGITNTALADDLPDEFTLEIFDGATGALAGKIENFLVGARRMRQIDSILRQYAPGVQQGYIHIVRTQGKNPYVAFAIINDGDGPGSRTGDGSFVSSSNSE